MRRSGPRSAMAKKSKSQLEDEERLLDEEYELDDTNYDIEQNDPLRPIPRLDKRKKKEELVLLEAMLRKKEHERVVQQAVARHVATRNKEAGASGRNSVCSNTCKALCALLFVLATVVITLGTVFSANLGDRLFPNSGLGVDTNQDYILDARWNFNAAPTRREYYWTIQDTVYNPDGVYRPMILINNQFPGPLIEVNEGDTIVVHINNQASNATAIHWHGLYQNGSNWMDGTVGITQCPIVSGGHFNYEFKVAGQSGTYWYHAHQGLQASDGMYGPLVIHSRDELRLQRLPYDSDRVVMVSDHYHDLSSDLLMTYLASDRENIEPVPDGALINGQGIRNCDDFQHRRCDNTTSNVGLPRFNLESGRNHRLRIINVGAFAEFQVSVDEHKFAITEVDGTDVEPIYYNRMNINPAQRYSMILYANSTAEQQFWLRAKMLTTCFGEGNPHLQSETRAIISYSNSVNATEPKSVDWQDQIDLECHDMDTSELRPAQVMAAPTNVDESFYLRSDFEIGAWRLSRGYFNKTSWRADPQSPSLFRAMEGLVSENKSFINAVAGPSAWVNDAAFDTNRELVIQTEGITVIDLVISNFDGM